MADDNRNDKAMLNFIAKSSRPNVHANTSNIPRELYSGDDMHTFADEIDTKNWVHVGTSPQLSVQNTSQARRAAQTFMFTD